MKKAVYASKRVLSLLLTIALLTTTLVFFDIGAFAKEEYDKNELTVNAAPYGLAFYKSIGFRSVSPMTCSGGIKYIGMKKEIGEYDGKVV